MDAVIATVVKIEGKVSAIDQAGQKRELIAGDLLYVDEVVGIVYLMAIWGRGYHAPP